MPVAKMAHAENVQRSLGRRIRELRSKRGWTQEQFAGICGIHRTYLGHVERGEKNVSLSTVLRVANALGIRVTALFGRGRESPDTTALRKDANGQPSHGLDVNRLLQELHSQRAALRHALHELSCFLMGLQMAKEPKTQK
jgi:transcriptional regulator with XRE-family HTH domain